MDPMRGGPSPFETKLFHFQGEKSGGINKNSPGQNYKSNPFAKFAPPIQIS